MTRREQALDGYRRIRDSLRADVQRERGNLAAVQADVAAARAELVALSGALAEVRGNLAAALEGVANELRERRTTG